jgi:hypothetical protein
VSPRQKDSTWTAACTMTSADTPHSIPRVACRAVYLSCNSCNQPTVLCCHIDSLHLLVPSPHSSRSNTSVNSYTNCTRDGTWAPQHLREFIGALRGKMLADDETGTTGQRGKQKQVQHQATRQRCKLDRSTFAS